MPGVWDADVVTAKRQGGGRPWRRLVAYVVERDGGRCQLRYPGTWPGVHGQVLRCLGVATTADHVVPVAQGGTDHPANLQAACVPCNQHRGTRPAPRKDEDGRSRRWTRS